MYELVCVCVFVARARETIHETWFPSARGDLVRRMKEKENGKNRMGNEREKREIGRRESAKSV